MIEFHCRNWLITAVLNHVIICRWHLTTNAQHDSFWLHCHSHIPFLQDQLFQSLSHILSPFYLERQHSIILVYYFDRRGANSRPRASSVISNRHWAVRNMSPPEPKPRILKSTPAKLPQDLDFRAKQNAIRQDIWFAKALKTDLERGTSLGTLSIFPVEIRTLIWKSLLACRFDSPRRPAAEWKFYGCTYPEAVYIRPWTYPVARHEACDDPCIFSFYNHGFAYDISYLRQVSKSIKSCYEDFFLSAQTFSFHCPRMLDHFLSRLPDGSRFRMFHIKIRLVEDRCFCKSDSDEGWKRVCGSLPKEIRTVSIELYDGRFALDSTGRLMLGLEKEVISLLELIGENLRYSIPNAVVSLAGVVFEALHGSLRIRLAAALAGR